MDWMWVFLSGDSDYVDDKSLAEAEKLKDQRAKELAIKEQAEAAAREKDALQNAENIGKLKEKIASGELSTKSGHRYKQDTSRGHRSLKSISPQGWKKDRHLKTYYR